MRHLTIFVCAILAASNVVAQGVDVDQVVKVNWNWTEYGGDFTYQQDSWVTEQELKLTMANACAYSCHNRNANTTDVNFITPPQWGYENQATSEFVLPEVDTDGDGSKDWEEWLAGTDPDDETDFPPEPIEQVDLNQDTDSDGWSDAAEEFFGTDPETYNGTNAYSMRANYTNDTDQTVNLEVKAFHPDGGVQPLEVFTLAPGESHELGDYGAFPEGVELRIGESINDASEFAVYRILEPTATDVNYNPFQPDPVTGEIEEEPNSAGIKGWFGGIGEILGDGVSAMFNYDAGVKAEEVVDETTGEPTGEVEFVPNAQPNSNNGGNGYTGSGKESYVSNMYEGDSSVVGDTNYEIADNDDVVDAIEDLGNKLRGLHLTEQAQMEGLTDFLGEEGGAVVGSDPATVGFDFTGAENALGLFGSAGTSAPDIVVPFASLGVMALDDFTFSLGDNRVTGTIGLVRAIALAFISMLFVYFSVRTIGGIL